MIHLTHTGFYAGTPICGAVRDPENEHAHAVMAPLHIPEYRARVCSECLRVYAESYDAEELAELPDDHWVKQAGGKDDL
jgi:hypothetical protein